MKKLFFALMLCALSNAASSGYPTTYRINMASTNLTGTFPDTPQISMPNKVVSYDSFSTGGSSTEIEINCSQSSTPTSTSGGIEVDSVSLVGGGYYSSPVGGGISLPFGKYCWFRSVSSTISSGIFEVVVYGY